MTDLATAHYHKIMTLKARLKKRDDEIERLREALQGAKTIINLLCQGFDVEPENVVINVTSENENGEEVFVKSISAQDVLTKIRAALGEEE